MNSPPTGDLTVRLRDVEEQDWAQIVDLNHAEVQHTSPMDVDRLQHLLQLSCYGKVAEVQDQVAAFLIALRAGVAYENDNYDWFATRIPDFLYVDRIVVGAAFAGHRIGSTMYTDLFGFARSTGIPVVTCEYNIEPPNLASKRFHDGFGFHEMGTQWVANGTKKVSLQSAEV